MNRRQPGRVVGAWLPAVLAGVFLAHAGACYDPVYVVERVQQIAGTIDTVTLFHDTDGDGLADEQERTLVLFASPTVDKRLRVRFWTPVPRSAFDPPEEFAILSTLSDIPTGIDAVYFEDDPANTDPGGPPANVVTFDLLDDMRAPGRDGPVPVVVQLNMHLLGGSPDAGSGTINLQYVWSPGPAVGVPPRVVKFEPNAPAQAGWGRAISLADLGTSPDSCNIGELLDSLSGFMHGELLEERIEPHHAIALEFDPPVIDALLTITPDDRLGFVPEAAVVPLWESLDEVRSETPFGLVPDTVYEVTVLSRYSTANMPVLTGTQHETGPFLVPYLDDEAYGHLVGDCGLSQDDLALASTYRFRTGPLRITEPLHGANLASVPDGVVMGAVQYADPGGHLLRPNSLRVTVELSGYTSEYHASGVAFVDDVIDQPFIYRYVGVWSSGWDLRLPAEPYDDLVTITVRAELVPTFPGIGEYRGQDKITIHYDNVVPGVSDVETLNEHSGDGVIDRICFEADCDVRTVTLTIGGAELTFDLSSPDFQAVTECTGGRRTYCVYDVGLPAGAPDGTGGQNVTIAVNDDQSNSSPSVTQAMPQSVCSMTPNRFVGVGHTFVRNLVLPDGTPFVVWADQETSMHYATWNGTAWMAGQYWVSGEEDVGTHFGLGFDMALDGEGRPVLCLVDNSAQGGLLNEGSTIGTLRVLRFAEGGWTELDNLDDVRPIGCAITTAMGRVVVGYVSAEGSTDPLESKAMLATIELGAAIVPREPIMRPPSAPEDSPQEAGLAWDLALAGMEERLYFAYRGVNTLQPVGTPGTLVVGYLTGSWGGPYEVHEQHVQHVRPPSVFGILERGAGTALAITPEKVHLAYVRSLSLVDATLYSSSLAHLWSSHPADGDALDLQWGFRGEDENQPEDLSFGKDGRSTPPPDNAVFYSAPDLAAVPGSEELWIAYQRTRSAVNLVRFSATEAPVVAVVDSWVGSNPPRTSVVQPSLGASADRVDVAFPSPAANRIAFFEKPRSRFFSGPASECPELYRDVWLAPDALRLRYVNYGEYGELFDLLRPTCSYVDPEEARTVTAPLRCDLGGALPVPLPRTCDGEIAIGQEETLLKDEFNGAQIRRGRGFLRTQRYVCVPDQTGDGDACNRGSGASFVQEPYAYESPASVQWTWPQEIHLPPSKDEPCDPPDAECACGASEQLVEGPEAGHFRCVDCPAYSTCVDQPGSCVHETFYDPTTGQCATCLEGSVLYSTGDGGFGVAPRVPLASLAFCASCGDAPQDPAETGNMSLVLAADGASCFGCSEGSWLLPCDDDLDCGVLGDGFRCAADHWGVRAGTQYLGRVCVRKCTSYPGICPAGTECSGEGACLSTDGGDEIVSSVDQVACRYLGCDVCFRNEYCGSCPPQHHCTGDVDYLAPLCFLRPMLSPVSIALMTVGDPEAERQLTDIRRRFVRMISQFRSPYIIDPGFWLLGSEIYWSTQIEDMDVILDTPDIPGYLGHVGLDVQLGYIDVVNPGWWGAPDLYNASLLLRFAPYVAAHHGGAGRMTGVRWQHVSTRFLANAWEGWGPQVGPELEDMIDLGGLVGGLMDGISETLGTAGAPRCMFVSEDGAPDDLPQACAPSGTEHEHVVRLDRMGLDVTLRRCP